MPRVTTAILENNISSAHFALCGRTQRSLMGSGVSPPKLFFPQNTSGDLPLLVSQYSLQPREHLSVGRNAVLFLGSSIAACRGLSSFY
jgi:hypothetical protein